MPRNSHSLLFAYVLIVVLIALSNLLAATRLQYTDETTTTSRNTLHYCNNGNNISWLGDNWILPRGCRVYSVPELQAIYGRFSILWIGDSTVRRTYATLRAILQHHNSSSSSLSSDQVDSPHIVDMNKDGVIQEPCRKWKDMSWIDPTSLCWKNHERNFDFIQARGLKDLILVFAHLEGTHTRYGTAVRFCWLVGSCASQTSRTFGRERLYTVLNTLRRVQFSSSLSIVWRTLGMN